MTTKVIGSGPDKPVRVTGDWLTASSRFSGHLIDALTGRQDVTVRIAPGAGHKSPACFFPELAVIEVDGTRLGVDPASVQPDLISDRKRYPAFSGLLAHEAGHARHSAWFTGGALSRDLSEEQLPWLAAALLLEEAREEKGQLDDRPQDQPFLQASATQIVAAEAGKIMKQGLSREMAGNLAALILARIDAGSVVPGPFTDQVTAVVQQVFGDDYPDIEKIWREALTVADNDGDAMLDLGRRWCELTGMGQETVIELSAEQARDLQKILDGLAQESDAEASGAAEQRRIGVRIREKGRQRQAEADRRRKAQDQAQRVFSANPVENDRRQLDVVRSWRPPQPAELALASRTRRSLLAACVPEKAVIPVRSDRPGGRLIAREARHAQAQADLGLAVTAQPFLRREREATVSPPLRVAIIQDVSGSQSAAAAAAAEGAWCLARAVWDIPRAQVAMLAFGNDVTAVVSPGQRLARVPQVSAESGSHHLNEALAAAEGRLMLLRRTDARLVVIITDGVFETTQLKVRDSSLARLAETGVRVLWLASDGQAHNDAKYLPRVPGVRVVTGARGDYQSLPETICDEAVRTLEAARNAGK
jgi:hypothetical protein